MRSVFACIFAHSCTGHGTLVLIMHFMLEAKTECTEAVLVNLGKVCLGVLVLDARRRYVEKHGPPFMRNYTTDFGEERDEVRSSHSRGREGSYLDLSLEEWLFICPLIYTVHASKPLPPTPLAQLLYMASTVLLLKNHTVRVSLNGCPRRGSCGAGSLGRP